MLFIKFIKKCFKKIGGIIVLDIIERLNKMREKFFIIGFVNREVIVDVSEICFKRFVGIDVKGVS